MLYAIALGVAWQQEDARADRRLETILKAAERGYSDVIDGEVDAALRYVGGAIINVLGRSCAHQSLARMQELAKTFNLDEVNIVNSEGLTIGSNIPEVLGFDFNTHPLTREFMALTNANTSVVIQPFRNGVANPEMFCKYHGMAFPEHDGFLQLGLTVNRLRQNMYAYSNREADRILKDWHFSVVGWYERVEDDRDFEAGRKISRWSDEHGERIVGRQFDYRGYHYVALLPESYCYAQRNATFAVIAAVLGVILFIFTYVLVRLAKASANLERLHAAALARTSADLALARTIQMSALPSADGAFMECLEFSLAAACRPAREVGGDFYDFFHVPGDRLAFLVADVSGKGIPGALFMMEAKNVLKNCLVEFADVAEAVTEANRRLCVGNKAEMFVTAWIGVLDRAGTFEYVNAGHNRPFIRHPDGTVEKIMGKGGRFLGMFEDATYRANVLKLASGDVLYLYTDGVTEAMNARHEQFGEARLRRALAAGVRDVLQTVSEFVGDTERSDDATDLVFRWNGSPDERKATFACAEAALEPVLAFIRLALPGVEKKTLAKILNATDEITSNIVFYSGAKEFSVSVERGSDRIRILFSDDGKAYNPLSHADPDTHAAIEDRPVGGLGLVVVKSLADRVAYARDGDRNVLTIITKA